MSTSSASSIFDDMMRWTVGAINATTDALSVPVFRKRPTWNIAFGAAIKVLRTAAYSIYRDIDTIRLLTDNAIPKVILPSGVECCFSADPKGEISY